MNYLDIKEKYPKAWEKYTAYNWESKPFNTLVFGSKVVFDKTLLESKFINRGLYDFFDENTLFVSVVNDSSHLPINMWFWTIDLGGLVNGCVNWISGNNKDNPCNSRKEAEEAAFTKAFELLEAKL